MKKLSIRTIDLIDIYADSNRDEHSGIFGFEPTLKEEERLGAIYLLGETVKDDENASYIINLVASIVKNEYYHNVGLSPEQALEISLRKANESLVDLSKQGHERLIRSLRFIAAVFCDNVLHLSQTGAVHSLIIRDGTITDIGESMPESAYEEGGLHLFSNIASGEVNPNDVIVLSSSPLDKRKVLIIQTAFEKNRDFGKAEREIRKNFVDFGEVILILNATEDTKGVISTSFFGRAKMGDTRDEEPRHDYRSRKEEEEVIEDEQEPIEEEERHTRARPVMVRDVEEESEDETDGYSPEDIKDRYENRINVYDRYKEKVDKDYFERRNPREEEAPVKEVRNEELMNSSQDEEGYKDFRQSRESKKQVLNLDSLKSLFVGKKDKNNDEDSSQSDSNRYFKLNLAEGSKYKYVYMAGIVIVIGLIGWGLFKIYKNFSTDKTTDNPEQTNNKPSNNNQANIDKIKTSIQNLSTVLGQGDVVSAKTAIANVETEIAKITSETDKKTLNDLLDGVVNTYDKAITVNPTQLISLTADNAPNSNAKLDIINKKIYYTGVQGLVSVTTTSPQAKIVRKDVGPSTLIGLKILDGGKIVLQSSNSGNKEIYIYTISSDTLKKVNLTSTQSLSSGIIGNYGSNIYVPTEDGTKMLKFVSTAAGFSSAQVWSPGLNLSTEVADITLDDALYILGTDGKIYKYYQGKTSAFTNPNMLKEVGGFAEIYTEKGMKNLYIADGAEGRIVVINKQGALVSQLKSEKFIGALDIRVYPADKKAYVLTADSIYTVDIGQYE